MKALRAMVTVLAAVAAGAQSLGSDGRGGAPQLEPKMPWMAIIYTLAGLAVICVVAFKRSGRTHLD